MNVIAQLEFELTYFVVAIQHFSRYATETPRASLVEWKPWIQTRFTPRKIIFESHLARGGDVV